MTHLGMRLSLYMFVAGLVAFLFSVSRLESTTNALTQLSFWTTPVTTVLFAIAIIAFPKHRLTRYLFCMCFLQLISCPIAYFKIFGT